MSRTSAPAKTRRRATPKAPRAIARVTGATLKPVRAIEPGLQGSRVELALDKNLLKRGWWFDTAEANRVVAFFEQLLHHSKGEWAGQKVVLSHWQTQRLRRLFGWRRPDGTRRYRRTFWWIPKKNGKSFIAAGIALYLTAFDGEPGAEVYSAAGNKEQASLVFDEATNMVKASKDLSDLFTLFKSSIFVQSSLSKYQVLSAKPGTKHGFNVHGIIVDEVHEFRTRELYDFLTSGTGARRQPLEVVISTVGSDIGSFGYELWEYSIKIRDGIFEDPECMVVVYAADPEDRWDDEKTWAKANPNLGISPKLEFLRGEVVKARGMPGFVPTFKRLYLNIWVQSAKAWLDLDKWRACPRCPRSIVAYRRRACYAGLDLSKTTDLSALVMVFPTDDGRYDVLPYFWCPEERAQERAAKDRVQYPLWIDQGYLRATPGNIVDYRAMHEDIRRLADVVRFQEIAYDPAYAVSLVLDLQDKEGLKMVPFRQGFLSMTAPSMELERRVIGKLINLPDNPVLTWMASNVVVRRDSAGCIKPDKEFSRERIDGIVALVMAIGRATLGQTATSVYETRGIVTL